MCVLLCVYVYIYIIVQPMAELYLFSILPEDAQAIPQAAAWAAQRLETLFAGSHSFRSPGRREEHACTLYNFIIIVNHQHPM